MININYPKPRDHFASIAPLKISLGQIDHSGIAQVEKPQKKERFLMVFREG